VFEIKTLRCGNNRSPSSRWI